MVSILSIASILDDSLIPMFNSTIPRGHPIMVFMAQNWFNIIDNLVNYLMCLNIVIDIQISSLHDWKYSSLIISSSFYHTFVRILEDWCDYELDI